MHLKYIPLIIQFFLYSNTLQSDQINRDTQNSESLSQQNNSGIIVYLFPENIFLILALVSVVHFDAHYK